MTVTEPFYHRLGQQIASIRQDKGLSQRELGERLEPRLQRASIANIETAKQRVLAHQLVQFAAALEVSVQELVDEPNSPVHDETQAVAAELSKKLPDVDIRALTKELGLVDESTRKLRRR